MTQHTVQFNFHTETTYSIYINDEVTMKIQRSSSASALVYFADRYNNRIDIPRGIIIRNTTSTTDNTHSNNIEQRILGTQLFSLAWSENYTIEYSNIFIALLNSQRSWNIETHENNYVRDNKQIRR